MACTRDGPDVNKGTALSSIGGGFAGGVAVGVVFSLLLVLVVFRGGWGKDFLEHFWTLLKGDGDAGMRKSGWRGFVVSVGGKKKVSPCRSFAPTKMKTEIPPASPKIK